MNPNILRNSIVGLAAVSVTLTAVVVGVKTTGGHEAAAVNGTESSTIVTEAPVPTPAGIAIDLGTATAITTTVPQGTSDAANEITQSPTTEQPIVEEPEPDTSADPDPAPAEGPAEEAPTPAPDEEAADQPGDEAAVPAPDEEAAAEEAAPQPADEAEPAAAEEADASADPEPDAADPDAGDPDSGIDLSWLAEWLAEQQGSILDADILLELESLLDSDDGLGDAVILDLDDLTIEYPNLCDRFPELCDPALLQELPDTPITVDLPSCMLVVCGPEPMPANVWRGGR